MHPPQGRLYHLFDLFEILDHKMIVSSTALLLIRNFTYMFFSVHWMVSGRGALGPSWRRAMPASSVALVRACKVQPGCEWHFVLLTAVRWQPLPAAMHALRNRPCACCFVPPLSSRSPSGPLHA